MDRAKAQLVEATTLGDRLRTRRVELAEAETRLKRARAIVDAMDRADVPAKSTEPPAR